MRAARRTIVVAAIGAITAIGLGIADRGAAAAQSAAGRFSGTYRWVGGDAEIRELDRAIDECVKHMNFFIRGIARRRIRPPNLPAAQLVIDVSGGQVTVSSTGHPPVTAPDDGTPVDWTLPNGERFKLSHGVDPSGALYQRFEDGRSRTVHRYLLGADGKRLTIETTIESKYMPQPLRITKTYERM